MLDEIDDVQLIFGEHAIGAGLSLMRSYKPMPMMLMLCGVHTKSEEEGGAVLPLVVTAYFSAK